MDTYDEKNYDLGLNPEDLRHSQLRSTKRGAQLVNLRSEQYEYVGDIDLFDTSIPGVIALNGGMEASKGPAIIIKDISTSPIKMLWTDSLIGCIGLSMTGINKETGVKDAFFAHMRHWDRPQAEDEPDNPMNLAKRFVDSHHDIRLHWGTDFFFGKLRDLALAIRERSSAQSLLSHKLGLWVRDADCVVQSVHTFLPTHEVVYPEKPAPAYERMLIEAAAGQLQKRIAHGEAKKTKRFEPDETLLGRLKGTRDTIHKQLYTMFSSPLLANSRRNKIDILDRVLKAYESGNLDDLELFAQQAEIKNKPKTNRAINKTRKAVRMGKNEIERLIREAYNSAKSIIMESNDLRGGLRPDGTPYVHDDDYVSSKHSKNANSPSGKPRK